MDIVQFTYHVAFHIVFKDVFVYCLGGVVNKQGTTTLQKQIPRAGFLSEKGVIASYALLEIVCYSA